LSPVKIDGLCNIVHIWCGGFSSFVADGIGSMWVFGRNNRGTLGLLDSDNRLTPTENPHMFGMCVVPGANHTICVDQDGSIYASGCNSYGQLARGDTSARNYLARIENFNMYTRISPIKSAK
jgi:alpha-tubulin suppressor-like RCC1 family protein